MNPSVDIRIDSMIRALSDFVMPELPTGGTGAEQAALVLGHLQVLRDQIDVAVLFEEFELRHTVDEARSLLKTARGGDRIAAAVAGLQAAVNEVDARSPEAVRRSAEQLRSRIEELLRACAQEADPATMSGVQNVVVASERVLANATRSLFAGNGWEGEGDQGLPDLTALVSGA